MKIEHFCGYHSTKMRQNERAALGRVGVDDGADAFTACYANSYSVVDCRNARAPANLPNRAIENRQRKNSTPSMIPPAL